MVSVPWNPLIFPEKKNGVESEFLPRRSLNKLLLEEWVLLSEQETQHNPLVTKVPVHSSRHFLPPLLARKSRRGQDAPVSYCSKESQARLPGSQFVDEADFPNAPQHQRN
jgi:hypothetical protein